MKRMLIGFVVLCLFASSSMGRGHDNAKVASRKIELLKSRVPAFTVIELKAAPGELALTAEQSLTVDMLRGVPLDANPPVLKEPTDEWDPRQTDSFPPGEAPYVARGIRPFRFHHFNCEFNYGGWHNFAMQDYAAAHGFNIIYPYIRDPSIQTHMPTGTQWLRWTGFGWHRWMEEHDIGKDRYDQLADIDDLVERMIEAKYSTPADPDFTYHMIDMEHGRLTPDKLRQQPWFPKDAAEAEQEAFVKKYYDGYARTYTAMIEASRRAGWRNISVYGWQPVGREYWHLESARSDPETDWEWNYFGQRIYRAVDILNPTVYCFYWTPANVAYTLANIDLNVNMIRNEPIQKPIRPYYWTLLHGGGGGWRWWRGQPIASEDVRAMIAMSFFTGIDGFDTWNWSGTGNHHRNTVTHRNRIREDGEVRYETVYNDLMVGSAFEANPLAPDAAEPRQFERYDVLHTIPPPGEEPDPKKRDDGIDEEGMVYFRPIEKGDHQGKMDRIDARPVYTMAWDELKPHLRATSDPVSAMIEGMALAKPFEFILRHGEVKIDVPATEQFAKTLPIVRRVTLGPYHVLIAYDPLCVHEGKPGREIRLENFDGQKGRTLVLPADSKTRVFVLREVEEKDEAGEE